MQIRVDPRLNSLKTEEIALNNSHVDFNGWAREYARNRRVNPVVLTNLLEIGALSGDSRILEVGCGTGNYIFALQSALGCSCWGCDPSEKMLAEAACRTDGVIFGTGIAERLDFPDNHFDLAFSVDVIHHVNDHSAYFQEVFRVLRPGGRICTATDSEWIIRHRTPMAKYFPGSIPIELQRYPRTELLQALMKKSGFKEIHEVPTEFPYELAELGTYQDKAFSILHLIPESAYQNGLAAMKRDLASGPLQCVSYYALIWGNK